MDKNYDEESNLYELLSIFKLFRIKNKEDDIMRKLRKLKFNLNLQYDRDGETLLHRAVRGNMILVVKYLVENGADTGIRNIAGESPLDLAKECPGMRKLLDMREQAMPSQDSTTQCAPGHSSTTIHPVPETVERFLEKGTSGIHGNLYEVMMSGIILSRCVQRNFKFNLATNISNIGKFDDIVVQIYSEDRKRVVENFFIQLKHNISNKSDAKTQTRITLNDLTTKKDEGYSIVKYYFSYRDLQSKILIEDTTKLVIFTNLKLHHDVQSFFSMNDKFTHLNFKNVSQRGKILSINKSALEKTLLMRNILDYEYTWVSRTLVKSFKSREPIDLGQSHLPLTRYFPYLAQRVLRVQEIDGQYYVRGFQSNFIRGNFDGQDSNHVESLHSELIKILSEKSSTYKQESRNEASLDDLNKMSIQDLDTYLGKRRIPILHWDQIMCNNWPHVTEEEMGEFFNKFIFAVDQPDVEQLQQVLCDEMGEQRHLALEFKEKVLKWYMMATHNFTEKNGRIMLDALKVKIQSERYSDVLDTYKIKYREEALGKIMQSINKVKYNMICIGSKEPTLTTIKLCQALYKHNNIIIHSAKYMVENRIIILDTLVNNCFHMLVINCDDDDFSSVNNIFSTSHCTNTKIILIKKAHSADECAVTDEFNFSDMTEDTRDYYLRKVVNFQGNIVAVGDMLPGTVDDVVVGRLVRGEDIIIGSPLTNPHDKSYIPRRVKFPIRISDEIFEHKFSKDVFAISERRDLDKSEIKNHWVSYQSFDPKDKYDIIILDQASAREQYDSLCEKINTEYCIHLIFCEIVDSLKILKLVQTRGDISTIKQYLKSNSISSVEDIVKEKDCRVVVVSDTVGTGKTRLMQEIGYETKTQRPRVWVIQIYLSQQTKLLKDELDNMKGHKFNYDSATNLLVKFTTPSEETPGWRQWTLRLLRRYIESENICILIDSFDEISPDYTELVLNLLEALISMRVPKLYLATRPNLQKTLEDRIHVLSFKLDPFTSQERVVFLRNYLVSIGQEQLVEDQCRELGSWISSSKNINKLADSVMYLQLIAEYWSDKVKHRSATELEQNLVMVDLYEHFLNKTFQYYEMKINIDSKPIQGVINTLNYTMSILFQEIAFHQLLPNYYYKYFPSSNIKDAFIKLYEFNSECTGLLHITQSGEPYFILRSFCEFLVSKFIYSQVNINQNPNMEILIKTNVLTDPEFFLVKQFINEYLENTSFLNMTGSVNDWESLLLEALQAMCKSTHLGILKLLFSCIKKRVYGTVFKSLDSKGDPLLHIAAKHGQYNVVKWLIQEVNYPIDCLNADGGTTDQALILYLEGKCSKCPHRNEIENLYDFLKCIKNKMNNLTLWCAVCLVDLPVVESTLTEDMLYTRGPHGYTALESALICFVRGPNHNTKEDIMKMIEIFLKLGYDIDLKHNERGTILHISLENSKIDSNDLKEVIKLLVDKGADLDTTNDEGGTPLHVAIVKEHYDLIPLLINRTNVNIADKYGETPLHDAIKFSAPVNIIRLLLDAGANMHLQNNSSRSALYLAAKNVKSIVQLISSDVMKDLDEENSPLYMAVARKREDEVIKCLVNEGADLSATNRRGRTALHAAIINQLYSLVPSLLNCNNVNKKDYIEHTCLHYAVLVRAPVDVISQLLDAGATVHLQDNTGRSALHVALYSQQHEPVPLLLNPTSVNIRDNDGNTPLHVAIMEVKKNRFDIIKLLLRAGADVHLQDNIGRLALHAAIYHDQCKVVQLLINPTDINTQDKYGYTPLHSAVMKRAPADIIRMLLDAGANVHLQDRDGDTVLDVAEEYYPHILNTLISYVYSHNRISFW